MQGQGNDGGKMVTLGKVFSLATPLGAIMGKFDFYGFINRWKINLRQLWTLRCLVTRMHVPKSVYFYADIFIFCEPATIFI